MGQANVQLANQIFDECFKRWCSTKNIIHDIPSANTLVKNYTSGRTQVLQGVVRIMDEYNEDHWSIYLIKRHHKVGVFCANGQDKGKFISR